MANINEDEKKGTGNAIVDRNKFTKIISISLQFIKSSTNAIIPQTLGEEWKITKTKDGKKTEGWFHPNNKGYWSRICSDPIESSLQQTGAANFVTAYLAKFCIHMYKNCCFDNYYETVGWNGGNNTINFAEALFKSMDTSNAELNSRCVSKKILYHLMHDVLKEKVILKLRIDDEIVLQFNMEQRTYEGFKKDIGKNGRIKTERVQLNKDIEITDKQNGDIVVVFKRDTKCPGVVRKDGKNPDGIQDKREFVIGFGYRDEGEWISQTLYAPLDFLIGLAIQLKIKKTISKMPNVGLIVEDIGDGKEYILFDSSKVGGLKRMQESTEDPSKSIKSSSSKPATNTKKSCMNKPSINTDYTFNNGGGAVGDLKIIETESAGHGSSIHPHYHQPTAMKKGNGIYRDPGCPVVIQSSHQHLYGSASPPISNRMIGLQPATAINRDNHTNAGHGQFVINPQSIPNPEYVSTTYCQPETVMNRYNFDDNYSGNINGINSGFSSPVQAPQQYSPSNQDLNSSNLMNVSLFGGNTHFQAMPPSTISPISPTASYNVSPSNPHSIFNRDDALNNGINGRQQTTSQYSSFNNNNNNNNGAPLPSFPPFPYLLDSNNKTLFRSQGIPTTTTTMKRCNHNNDNDKVIFTDRSSTQCISSSCNNPTTSSYSSNKSSFGGNGGAQRIQSSISPMPIYSVSPSIRMKGGNHNKNNLFLFNNDDNDNDDNDDNQSVFSDICNVNQMDPFQSAAYPSDDELLPYDPGLYPGLFLVNNSNFSTTFSEKDSIINNNKKSYEAPAKKKRKTH